MAEEEHKTVLEEKANGEEDKDAAAAASPSAKGEEEREEPKSEAPAGRDVLICGYTGATGKPLMRLLLGDPRVGRIVCIGRRESPEVAADLVTSGKVVYLIAPEIYNLDEVRKAPEIAEGRGKYSAAFCCLGTTHPDAGSNAAFRRIDLDGVASFGQVARAVEAPTFCFVSSAGASSSSWFNYMKTKGLAEEALTALGFPRLGLFRPGMLDRGADTRSNEKIAKWFAPTLPVETLARALFNFALDGREVPVKVDDKKKKEEEKEAKEEEHAPKTLVIDGKGILELAKMPAAAEQGK